MTPFYLCTNPEVVMPEDIVACIYSYKKPRFFAVVEKIGQAGPVAEISYKGANVIFSFGLDGETQQDYLLAVNDNVDETPYDKLNKTLQKAVEWYINVRALETKAKRLDFSMLSDYSPLVPHLQAVHYDKTDEFLLSYGLGIKGFKTLAEMEAFMQDQLRLSDEVVGKGDVCTGEFD